PINQQVDTYKPEQISFDDIATIDKINEPLTITATTTAQPEATSRPDLSERVETPMTGMPIFKDPQHLEAWDKRLQQEKAAKIKVVDSTEPRINQPAPQPTAESEEETVQNDAGFPDLRYIGQIHGTYLVAESQDGFYLIDQHAAQ